MPQFAKENLPNTLSTNSTALTRPNPTSPAIIDLYNRFGEDSNNLLAQFNPSLQVQYCRDVRRVHTGKAPRIDTVALAYGNNAAESWLEIQLINLSEFAGAKEKLTPTKTAELAQIIIEKYPHYKLTEFMLFFVRFKSGEYGRFYGVIDPIIIMEALSDFNDERAYQLQQYEQERKRAEDAEAERIRIAKHKRYKARIPEAYTDNAPMNFNQYTMLGYDEKSDDEVAHALAEIAAGRLVLPTSMNDLCEAWRKTTNSISTTAFTSDKIALCASVSAQHGR